VKLAAEHSAFLARELGVEPPPELAALAGRLHGKRSGAELPPHPPVPLPFQTRASPVATGQGFVGREAELARLGGHLEGALGGNGQVVFITGEAGSGKTALADEFCRRAAESNQDLVVVSGHGNAYLLFREVLNQLSGDVEDRYAAGSLSPARATRLWNLMPVAAAALFDVGPDLLDTLVSSQGLAARVAGYARAVPEWEPWARRLHERSEQRSAALPPQAMFDQYVRVLKTVARARPVVVLLDDLQWADDGSVSLLFQLARELVGSRILVLGLFRPSDVALGRASQRHPMDTVVHEL
jgi:predicted ATPase